MRTRIALGALAAMLVAGVAGAQPGQKVPVEVRHTGQDAVGMIVAAELKEALTKSARFDFQMGVLQEISLTSLDINANMPGERLGNWSSISYQFSLFINCEGYERAVQYDWTHGVAVVGRNHAKSTAEGILASFVQRWDARKCLGPLKKP